MGVAPLVIMMAAQVVMGAMKGQSQSKQLKAQGRAAQAQGRYEMRKAEFEAAHIARDNRQLQAKQLAAFGASGFQVTGTPADVLAQDAIEGELNVLVKENQGAQAFLRGRNQNALLKSRARQAVIGGVMQGAASALSTYFTAGASSAAGGAGAGSSSVPVVESVGVPGAGAT